ncbi:MAG: SMP-30/gluconolactonase/LRE family protein [Steroidobacteraceae bacterium]|jgi:gluconolactonase
MRLSLGACAAMLFLCGASRAGMMVVDAHSAYPEGPLWRAGRLYFVEYAGPGVRVWDGKRLAVFWGRPGCGASGLIDFGRHLLVACYDSNSLVELDEEGHEVRVLARDAGGKPFVGPNDFAADGAGGVYFSASGVFDLAAPITGAVLHLTADGRITELANTIHYSNGLTVAKDGRHLLVAEMLAGRILSFPIEADGTLGPRSVWARLEDLARPTAGEDAFDGPDGLKLGPDGNYYIAQNGSGRILVVGADKKLVRIIAVPSRYVTNMNFGADGAATLFITAAVDPWKTPFPGAVYRWTR